MVAGVGDTITLWTSNPILVRWAGRNGIERIGLDLERIGKEQRQRGYSTWISPHRIEDLNVIKPELGSAKLFVRCNPVHSRSAVEIAKLIEAGVEVLMLPNFTSANEVENILRIVDHRALVVPLVERVAALGCLRALSSLGVKELHIGLNDLSIELGLSNRLLALSSNKLQIFSEQAKALGLKFGLGGLGRAMDTSLPVPSDLVYAQYVRLGASGALLARSFFNKDMREDDFAYEISRLRERLNFWRSQSHTKIENVKRQLMLYADMST